MGIEPLTTQPALQFISRGNERRQARSRRYREALEYVINSGQSYERVQEIEIATLADEGGGVMGKRPFECVCGHFRKDHTGSFDPDIFGSKSCSIPDCICSDFNKA